MRKERREEIMDSRTCDIVSRAGNYKSGERGWLIRRYLPGMAAWEPEEDSLRRERYPTRKAAEAALGDSRCRPKMSGR